MEEYRTISGQASAEIEEKKSRFIGHIAFADTEEKALAFLESVRAKHRTANHNVYAYCAKAAACGTPTTESRRKHRVCRHWMRFVTRV